MKKQYQSEALMVLHQDAVGLYELGLIDDATMRSYDEGCLVQEEDQNPKSTPGARPAPATAMKNR
jgi:DNA-binding transcriptional regulator YiaG